MAPYEKDSDELPMVITDDVGVHSVHEVDDQFEICLLEYPQHERETLTSQTAKWIRKKINRKPKENRNRTVRFSETVSQQQIPHKSDITPAEKSVLWINDHDWQRTQRERLQLGRAIITGQLVLNNPKHRPIFRGLETLFPEVNSKRRANIHAARSMVLREQASADLYGEALNVERLGLNYASLVRYSRSAALQQGMEDYCVALEDDQGNIDFSYV